MYWGYINVDLKPERKLFSNLGVIVLIKVIILLMILFFIMPPSKRDKVRDEFGLSFNNPMHDVTITHI